MKRMILISAALLALNGADLQAAALRQEKSVVAVVNGKNITAGDIGLRLWWQAGIQALTELIDERLILDEAAKMGIKADPKQVEQAYNNVLAAAPDKAQVEKNLALVGWTMKDLKDQLARQITVRDTLVRARNIQFPEEAVRKFFEENKEKLATPEALKLRQIFVASEADANAAVDALITGSDFAKLSELKSIDPALRQRKGELGFVPRGQLVPAIETELFKLKPGQYSKPIQTERGFAIFLVEEKRDARAADYEQIKGELLLAMVNQAITQQLPLYSAELRQKSKIEIKQ